MPAGWVGAGAFWLGLGAASVAGPPSGLGPGWPEHAARTAMTGIIMIMSALGMRASVGNLRSLDRMASFLRAKRGVIFVARVEVSVHARRRHPA